MKEAIGSSPDARVMMPEVRGDHGWMRSRQAASSRTVEILGRGISPWRRQPVSNHTSTEDSLQDSEPLFRRPTRVVYTSFCTVYSAPISRAVGTPAVECLREDTFSMDPPALFKTR